MRVREVKVFYSKEGNRDVTVKSSNTVYEVALEHWDKNIIEFQEEVKLMLLNRANVILGIYDLSKGGVSGSSVDLKIVLSVALKANASSIVLIHNHPSGKLVPSLADIRLTKKLKDACELIDLVLLDHLIISKESYCSFKDDGRI